MKVPGYTADDLTQAPRWHVGPAGEAFIAKGRFILIVLVPGSLDGTEVVYIYSHGELIGVRGSKDSAVDLAEGLVARWYPNDPKVAKPDVTPSPGTKTSDGKKIISANRFGAPV